MPDTYTFIADFRGGTYCSQVTARNIQDAFTAWIKKLEEEKSEIKHLGLHTIEELRMQVSKPDFKPILLRELKNVWCFSYSTKKGHILINIVKTAV